MKTLEDYIAFDIEFNSGTFAGRSEGQCGGLFPCDFRV